MFMRELELCLLAEFYSRLTRPRLENYFRSQALIASGESLWSRVFLAEDPALFNEIQNTAKAEHEALRAAFSTALEAHELIYLGHPDYPSDLIHLAEPAFLLRLKGTPVWRRSHGFAVVGSREPSALSLQWMEEHLSSAIESLDLFTVSGGARGVDQKLHSLSLRKEAPTVAVIPSGLDKIYPDSLTYWLSMILEKGGAILSEYSHHVEMRKHHFLARNRLIAGLGVATLVIEARKRSGTLITARQAMEQGKPVLVLPSHPLDIKSRGGLDLICEGATPVRDAEDLCVFIQSEFVGKKLCLPPVGPFDRTTH